jgi:hypothetical protein
MRPTDLGSISATRSEIHATDAEIGAAELYLHESVLKTSLGRAAAPPWLEAFVDTLHQIQQTVEQIEQDQKRTTAAIQNIERSQRRTSAVIENMRIAKSNVELAKNTGSTSYLAKQKEVRCASVYSCDFSSLVIIFFFYFLARLTGMAQS